MNHRDFAFGKENFIWIGIAIACIIIGFVLMSGGSSSDGISFNPAIFSKQRIVVAPAVTMVGFLLMVYGILKGGKKEDKEVSE
ncbi:MAG: DUF3098 domain-containing protein [Tannerella sp.]|jgi:formate-dependent nitrite reductase membrane component NrfD|nr:DUF3098 domain-containing protein [Tannerella sp.]